MNILRQFINEAIGEVKSSKFKGRSIPWITLNKRAEKMGEFGIATMSEEDMDQLIDMKRANMLAEKLFGEFGFATLNEDEMEELINKHPELIR